MRVPTLSRYCCLPLTVCCSLMARRQHIQRCKKSIFCTLNKWNLLHVFHFIVGLEAYCRRSEDALGIKYEGTIFWNHTIFPTNLMSVHNYKEFDLWILITNFFILDLIYEFFLLYSFLSIFIKFFLFSISFVLIFFFGNFSFLLWSFVDFFWQFLLNLFPMWHISLKISKFDTKFWWEYLNLNKISFIIKLEECSSLRKSGIRHSSDEILSLLIFINFILINKDLWKSERKKIDGNNWLSFW